MLQLVHGIAEPVQGIIRRVLDLGSRLFAGLRRQQQGSHAADDHTDADSRQQTHQPALIAIVTHVGSSNLAQSKIPASGSILTSNNAAADYFLAAVANQ
jgi:hypothetical protein